MSEENSEVLLDHEKANPRSVAGCEVQTIPKRWWDRTKVRNMLVNAHLFLTLKNGILTIEIRKPKEGELIEG